MDRSVAKRGRTPNLFEQARTRTASIAATTSLSGRELTAAVTVTNATGHRFPSGVGFRRAWIEPLVIDKEDERPRLVWSSGRTNEVGVIVDADGRPLPSEFFTDYTDAAGRPQQHCQIHHETITSSGQVQIYEELLRDHDVDPKNVSVQARLFYQSIPPYYLNQRFTASKGPATERLYYLTSSVNLAATPMEGWKIAIAGTSASVVK